MNFVVVVVVVVVVVNFAAVAVVVVVVGVVKKSEIRLKSGNLHSHNCTIKPFCSIFNVNDPWL